MSSPDNPSIDDQVPKLTRITRQLETSINRIRTEGGFRNTLTAQRPIIGQEVNRRVGAAVIIQDSARRPDQATLGCDEWIQSYTIEVYIGQSKDSTLPLDEYDAIVRADIEQALLRDDSDWAMKGEALGTEVTNVQPSVDVGSSLVVIAVTVDVHYRTDLGNAYSA